MAWNSEVAVYFRGISQDLKGFMIAMAVLNMLCMLMTLAFNGLALLVLVFVRSLHTASNSLQGAMCATDVVIALLVQTVYQAMIHSGINPNGDQDTGIFATFAVTYSLFKGTLCLIIALISMDRYTAVCQPFFYLGRVTVVKYLTICGTICGVWALFCILVIAAQSDIALYWTMFLCMIFALAAMIFCCVKILIVVHKQRTRIQTVGKISGSSNTNNRRQKESGKAFFIVIEVAVFAVGSLPSFMAYLFAASASFTVDEIVVIINVAILLANINCVINPLIYCLRSTEIRKGAKKLLRRSDYW